MPSIGSCGFIYPKQVLDDYERLLGCLWSDTANDMLPVGRFARCAPK